MRGLLDRLLEQGRQRPVGGFFAAIGKPAPEGLDSAHAYLLGIPQPVVVHLLEEHAIELGAEVRRGCAVAGFEQDDEGVTVELADGERLRSRYLVGCDGARSTVRKRLGVGFPGEPSRNDTLMGEMASGRAAGGDRRRVGRGPRPTARFGVRPVGEGVYSVVVPAAGVSDRAQPPTLDDFQRAVARRRRHRLRRALPALAVPLRRCHPAGRALPGRAGAAGRRRGAHPSAHRRAGPQPGRPGRVQPRLEAGRAGPRLGAGDAAGHLPRRTPSGRRGRAGQHPRPDGAARRPNRARRPCAGCSPS